MNDISIRPTYLGETVKPDAFSDTIGFAQPPRISMKDDSFNVIDENNIAVVPRAFNIDVIMLWENDTRIYFPKDAKGNSTYDPDNPIRPTCFSDNRVTPSIGAMQPQSTLCANCQHAKWDQPTPRGNLVPACDSRYKVACLVAGAGGRAFLLSVPPASRKAYEYYRRHLRAHHANPYDVVTKLGYQDKMFTFEFSGWVTEGASEFVRKLLNTDEPPLVVNAFDKPIITDEAIKTIPAQQAAINPIVQSGPDWSDKTTLTGSLPQPDSVQIQYAKEVLAGGPPSRFSPGTEEPKRPRGRPPKAAGEATSASPAASNIQASAKGNGGFGIESPTAPPTSIQEALDKAFGPR